ncbi:MAG TPA: ZIP family metal transporter [bacterium]
MSNLNPVFLAVIAGIFIWAMSAFGASFVFLSKEPSRKLYGSMLGFAGGVMIAASYWSLLAPAIKIAGESGHWPWLPAAIGFLAGSFFIMLLDKLIPHLHLGFPIEEAEGINARHVSRSILLILAITIHNIPEGLAVGVAFGTLSALDLPSTFTGAVAVALGIGIQDVPEGLAVAMPLRGMGLSRLRSFWYGQLSAIVEPVAAIVGALAVTIINPLLPYALSFAAGAMIYVVIEEVIPESQRGGNTDLATMSAIFGFIVMMILDNAVWLK